MRKIVISDTLTGKKQELQPLEKGHVKIYACGVTVYDHCHIGHAMQAIYFDAIRRYLEYAGYQVTYVRNYTDVDDKIINKAATLGISPLELSQQIIDATVADMKAIGVAPANHEPKVSEYIPEIIDMIQELISNGFAYATSQGDVYYRVRKKNDYGKLSNRKIEELISHTRELAVGEKEDSLDFALWKSDTTAGACWNSPWGKGRPGWHIECSAMAKAILGKSFDIHGGGRDLVFPHHENEIAQSEAANCCNYASIWMHSGLLTINKQKMSKSLGNHILIKDFIKQFPGEVLRLAYLQNQYSSNVDFNESVFYSCLRKLLYFYETLQELDQIAQQYATDAALLPEHQPQDFIEAFHKEMSHDFSTVCALRDLHLGLKKARELSKLKKSPARSSTAALYTRVFRELFDVFGLLQEDPTRFIESLKDKILPQLGISRSEIEQAITQRKEARAHKEFTKADSIRNDLSARGIELQDMPTETRWTIKIPD